MTSVLSHLFLKEQTHVLHTIYNCVKPAIFCSFNENDSRKHYSHQVPKEVNESSTIPALKKRATRRKKLLLDGEPSERSALRNVTAFSTAEAYDLNGLYTSLLGNTVYQPSQFCEQLYKFDGGFNFLHVVAKNRPENEDKEIFLFKEGSVVAWNLSETEVRGILQFVIPFETNRYNETVVNDEVEVMPYMYSNNNNKSSTLQDGNIRLTPQAESKCILDKYTFSNGMILSVKLGIWETLLDQYILSLGPLTTELKLGKRITISRKEVLRKTGQLFALKHSINLSSDLLDIPDFYWEREELENLYLSTCRYFNIPRRTRVINEKLNHCIELLDLLSSHLSDKHHTRLEWMIIVLIMVEVVFEIIHYIRLRVE